MHSKYFFSSSIDTSKIDIYRPFEIIDLQFLQKEKFWSIFVKILTEPKEISFWDRSKEMCGHEVAWGGKPPKS